MKVTQNLSKARSGGDRNKQNAGTTIQDKRPEAEQIRSSLEAIKNSPQVKQAKALQAMINQAPPQAPAQLAGGVVQLAILPGSTAKYTDAGHTRARTVEVENLAGHAYGPGHNSPTASVFGWTQLGNGGHILGAGANSTHYNAVRMHLWSGRAGGPGNNAKNLVPGPAHVNSKMSAGPEAYLKNMINTGNRMWMKTEVTYAQNNNNPADFLNVVPNKITMEVGKMKKGRKYAAIGDVGPFGKGLPIVTWNQDIDLPGNPLAPADKTAIRNYQSNLDKDAMLQRVQNFSLQQLTAAYNALRVSVLKIQLMKAYPGIFQNMGGEGKADYLGLIAAHKIADTLRVDHGIASHKEVVDNVYNPLIESGRLARLQVVFNAYTQAEKKSQLKYGGWGMMEPMWGFCSQLVLTDFKVFKTLPVGIQYAKFSLLTDNERRDLINQVAGANKYPFLYEWAKQRPANNTIVKCHEYIEANINQAIANGFRLYYRHRENTENSGGLRRSKRHG